MVSAPIVRHHRIGLSGNASCERNDIAKTPIGRRWHWLLHYPVRRIANSMKTILTLFTMLMLVTGCASLFRTAGDAAFCESEPTDQVERQASREICR
jgi:hypothetical protein